MKYSILKIIGVVFFVSMLVQSCKKEDNPQMDVPNYMPVSDFKLHYYQNDSETKDEFETGLKWAFSFLGAELKKGSWDRSVTWIDANRISVDISLLGFSPNAMVQFNYLIQQFVLSEEYVKTGGIDAGRFIACVLNNSNHYNKIVGMPKVLDAYTATYQFLPKKAAIIESVVAINERLIGLPISSDEVSAIGYWAEELSGSLKDSTAVVEENEVMDIMANGQLRFGIYNQRKQLIGGSDKSLTIAGKPSKCLWCHETNIQPAFAAVTAIPGYFSPNQFDSIINVNRMDLDNYRSTLDSEIDFNDSQAHTESEKIYIRYFEPSAKRLALEWRISEDQVKQQLQHLTTHTHHEFPEFGQLYHREEVQKYSPYDVLPSASSARETVEFEIDLLP